MRIHASLNELPVHVEEVKGDSLTVPGMAVSTAELFRRRSMGLPFGVCVHGVTDIPEGMSLEQARLEALRLIKMNQERVPGSDVPPAADRPAEVS